MAHTACLVCFISTVNGRSKKRKKRSLLRVALIEGTQQNLSSVYGCDQIHSNQCNGVSCCICLNEITYPANGHVDGVLLRPLVVVDVLGDVEPDLESML
jgi:hypothetical protein